MTEPSRRVVIVGGGFGGLNVARRLSRAKVQITLVDRSNHHLFQPLLYQVATAGLSPGEIASPIRSILRKQRNTRVLLDEVVGVDLAGKQLTLAASGPLPFDQLVLAPGNRTSYFGHPEWAVHALGLKDLEDAIAIRRRVLLAFEAAERESSPAVQQRLLTFVVVGGGPTGVELAGAICELSRFALARDFRAIKPSITRVILLEGGDRILPALPPELSGRGLAQLRELGAEVRLSAKVTSVDAGGVTLGAERIEAEAVIWAAGVEAPPLTAALGVPLDRTGRVIVEQDCSVPGHPDVFVIGDAACFTPAGGQPLPGVAPVAMQQARAVAKLLSNPSAPRQPFRYRDHGMMATIGRSRAVAVTGRLLLSGFVAWVAWLFIHLMYLVGHRNRLMVLSEWSWSYFTYKRGARLITGLTNPGAPAPPRAPGAERSSAARSAGSEGSAPPPPR